MYKVTINRDGVLMQFWCAKIEEANWLASIYLHNSHVVYEDFVKEEGNA